MPTHRRCLWFTSIFLAVSSALVGEIAATSQNSPCPNGADCMALVALYKSLTFAGSGKRLPWPVTESGNVGPLAPTYCEWEYIQCDEQNVRVATLNLKNLQLQGELPNEIGLFGHAKEIYLYANEVSGAIPSSIGNLTYLTDLELDMNLFGGSLPESLGDLKNLTYLSFGYNKLTGPIPKSLGRLSK
jgi:Leucine-rich repeat (LRR) protein